MNKQDKIIDKPIEEKTIIEKQPPVKPVSVLFGETRESVVNILNNSNLPPFLLEIIMRDLYLEVKQISQQQCDKDKNKYETAMKEFSED